MSTLLPKGGGTSTLRALNRFGRAGWSRAATITVATFLLAAPLVACGTSASPSGGQKDSGPPSKCVRRSAPLSTPPHHPIAATPGPDGTAYVVTSSWDGMKFYSYDYLNDVWKELSLFPLSTPAMNASSSDVQLARTADARPFAFYVPASLGPHQTWIYDPPSDAWSRLADSSIGGNEAPPVTQDGATVYSIIQGTPDRFAAYDESTDHWSYLAPPPNRFTVLTGVAISDRRIYGLGTGDPDLIYDVSANAWSTAPNDAGTNGLNVGVFDGESHLYKIGGLCGTTPCQEQMWILDTGVLTWSQGPDLPAPWVVNTPAIYGCDGDVYVFSGPEAAPMHELPQYTLRYDPPTEMWDSSL